MFRKLLIANRGEIACRIIKTAKKYGIKTVAVYSSIDKEAHHVKLADESFLIGPPPPAKSYLNGEKIINVALEAKVQAIHPGYGFLSENAKFASLCQQKEIIFIGPPLQAISVMGDKREAKKLMEKAGVPVVPGYQGAFQDLNILQEQAITIGFPLLIKAAAGGGGKGMRLVTNSNDLENALRSAQREAKSSFDDDTVFLEKYIKPARHVEVQIFLDQQGDGIYLFDRDCSIQRRYQKIIEEAIAPNLKETTRQKMGETAIKAAKTVNYEGAGTVEFLVDQSENFYFMEMNTRLQVEHPVTEMITGLDLVEWQFRIASGESLPCSQEQIKVTGHAFEARIYAENRENNFAPSMGKITYFNLPPEEKRIRFDTGVTQNDIITPYYDPLIAKLIVHEKDRATALQLLQNTLEKIFIIGIDTNISFLHQICGTQAFKEAKIHTTLVEVEISRILKKELLPDEVLLITCFAELQQQKTAIEKLAFQSVDPYSPWFIHDNWRLFSPPEKILQFWYKEDSFEIKADELILLERSFLITGQKQNNYQFKIIYNNQVLEAAAILCEEDWHIFYKASHFVLSKQNPKASMTNEAIADNQFIAPIPGTVIEIFVEPNQSVKKGDRLLILEAMKMEHTLTATKDGVIQALLCKTGDLVDEGAQLLKLN
ncbi:acetyl/propionyl/methylcrotonyl-CoA carboxylase subunit alpha [Coxiella-like endosymbiont]|uniref:acetyl/propionyl/methylcrotonyl-CoA carboxylase subunit alpha n=1 Tax=Coxiella-like endosymbiont TaxID=1592897 RepID=UPI00272B03F1|nr:acetyl-CoA carboxylase biotin carboxylase subunit [Coxiella-like endosymbiont]